MGIFNPNVSPQTYTVPDTSNVRSIQATKYQGEFYKSGTVRKIKWEEEIEARDGIKIKPERVIQAAFKPAAPVRKSVKVFLDKSEERERSFGRRDSKDSLDIDRKGSF